MKSPDGPTGSGFYRSGGRLWYSDLRIFLRHKRAVTGGVVVLLLVLVAAAAPLLPLEDPANQDYDSILTSPNTQHLLGTDRLGRDTLSRLIHGGRTSLTVGILVPLFVLAVALPLGMFVGLSTIRIDNFVMRGLDVAYALPDLLLIIMLRAIFGGNLYLMLVAIALAFWPTVVRLVRAQTLSIREQEFVMAARAVGAGRHHIAVRHLLPNLLGPAIVAVTFLGPRAVFAEAALSYIGIGISPPTASWGAMVQEGYGTKFVSYGQVLFPTAAIALLMMAFTLLGDGLRDLIDPRTGHGAPGLP